MSKHILCGIALAFLLLSGCASNPDVQVVELSRNTIVYDEIIRINNCGGTGDSEQTKSRDFATTVEFGADISAGYQSFVQGSLSAKYSEYRNTSVSQRVVAPPGTNMEFVLRWSDDVRAGNVQVNGKSGTYEVRIPVSVEQISSRDLGCDEVASTRPTNTVPPVSRVQPTNTPMVSIPRSQWPTSPQEASIVFAKGEGRWEVNEYGGWHLIPQWPPIEVTVPLGVTLEGYNDGPNPPQTRRCMTVLGPAQVVIQGGTFWFPDYPENPLWTARKIYKEQSAWTAAQGGPTKCEAFGFQP